MQYANDSLDDLRARIDELDAKLVDLLAERFRITERVGEYKKQYDLPPFDGSREREIAERRARLCREAGLDPEAADEIFQLIIRLVRKRHREIRDA